jgi:tetratricopeptide (TPR) repeat protein
MQRFFTEKFGSFSLLAGRSIWCTKNWMSRPRFIALLLALITLAAYLPVAHNDFLNFDDDDYITNNQLVQNGLTWAGIQWAFTTWHAGNWHPLTWLSHMLDCQLFGLNPGAQHFVNVLFHTANSVLLLILLFRLTADLWPSAFVAALFAWHPLHVESVAWLAERKDVLSTFFEFLALLAYTQFVRQTRTNPALRAPASGHYWLALFLFALALLAKPMVVTLPFILLLLDYWPLQRKSAAPASRSETFPILPLVLEKWPFFLLATVSSIVTFLAQRSGGLVITLHQFPLPARLDNTLLSYIQYLWKALWPAGLAVVYPMKSQFPWMSVAGAAVLLLAVSGSVWHVRRQCPYFMAGWFWFLGTLVPVIGLVQTGGQAMADRYTYVPMIGIFIMIAFGIKDLIARFRLRIAAPTAAAASLVLGGCLILTERQLSYWKNSESLFRHAATATKNNDMAYYCLGLALAEQHKWAEAMVAYRLVERLAPDRYEIHRNLGDALAETGKPDAALAEYREAVRLNPQNGPLYDRLGILLTRLGRYEEAMRQYQLALQFDPQKARPYYLMGRALLLSGHDADAVGKFDEALRADPDDLPTLVFLASLLASSENGRIRNGPNAVVFAEKANALAGGDQPMTLEVLAMAYAEAGRFPEAEQIEQRALQLAQTAGLPETNAMSQRLETYRSGRPYRQSFSNMPQDFLKN